MKHSSPVVTKEHYFTENKAALDIDHMYSPRQEKQDHKLKAVKVVRMIKPKPSVNWIDIKLKLNKEWKKADADKKEKKKNRNKFRIVK